MAIQKTVMGVSLDEARRVIEAAEEKAKKISQPSNIAVVDAGANLVAFARMDGAWLGSIDIAQNKAFTARAFDIETKKLSELSQPKEQFFGIQNSNQGRVMIFAGGIPLTRDGIVVGAIGVSGGMGEQDQAVAEAGAKTFESQARAAA
ncbi:MAG: GlcG/HbpS family heme-binding protein [Acidobacteriaceae bacterium]